MAYLYSNNGMASWCWEAAHALHELNQQVLLVCSGDAQIPASSAVPIFRFDHDAKNSHSFIYNLHSHLQRKGIMPRAYFLNTPIAQDPHVKVPQYVVAWSYPVSLLGYILKLGKIIGWKSVKRCFSTLISLVWIWREDWRGYQGATTVLSVSEKIRNELCLRGIKAHLVYPGTRVTSDGPPRDNGPVRKLIIAAIDLEDYRKRVIWMIKILRSLRGEKFELTLAGEARSSFKKRICGNGLRINFTGLIPRDKLQSLLAGHDIFLFGSCLDDWGYVLAEAMSQGLCVIAPDISPFDEMVGDQRMLYKVGDKSEFKNRLQGLLHSDLVPLKEAAWQRANDKFSRRVFGQALFEISCKEQGV